MERRQEPQGETRLLLRALAALGPWALVSSRTQLTGQKVGSRAPKMGCLTDLKLGPPRGST